MQYPNQFDRSFGYFDVQNFRTRLYGPETQQWGELRNIVEFIEVWILHSLIHYKYYVFIVVFTIFLDNWDTIFRWVFTILLQIWILFTMVFTFWCPGVDCSLYFCDWCLGCWMGHCIRECQDEIIGLIVIPLLEFHGCCLDPLIVHCLGVILFLWCVRCYFLSTMSF